MALKTPGCEGESFCSICLATWVDFTVIAPEAVRGSKEGVMSPVRSSSERGCEGQSKRNAGLGKPFLTVSSPSVD